MTKIGLEIHCQLTGLKSKLFCPCKADYRGMDPNTNVCPVCLGMPGTLPRLNRAAVKKALTIAKALHCQSPDKISFFRKNYFYPDLPKNFQITQLDLYGPASIGSGGTVDVEDKKIRITRIQLEEDPGRLIYEGASEKTQITLADYNRAGAPLVEIVTEPDFEDPRQVRVFLNLLSDLIQNLGVSDPGLEGAMRADGNISIEGGPKVELKNINSFHDLEKALEYELVRQNGRVSRGLEIAKETRHWDERRKITVGVRSKVEAMDYRYFMESDIPRVVIDQETVRQVESDMPESISTRRERYIQKYGISHQVAEVLSSDRYCSDLFELARRDGLEKDIANMITTDVMALLDTREKREASRLEPGQLAGLIRAIQDGRLSRNSGKSALYEMVKTGESAEQVTERLGLGNVADASSLEKMIAEVMSEQPKAVEEARANPQAINYLVGQVMKKSGNKADPKLTLELIGKALKK